MTRHGLYYIGGASGTGKTTTAVRLGDAFAVPVLELDDLQRAIMPVVPDHERRVKMMRRLALEAIHALLAIEAYGIVEGAWLEPVDADRVRRDHSAAFHPVFCGYHDTDAEPRLREIRRNGRHWTAGLPDEDASIFLRKQLVDSETLRGNCQALGVPYFDFTSRESGVTLLERDFRELIERRVTRDQGYDAISG